MSMVKARIKNDSILSIPIFIVWSHGKDPDFDPSVPAVYYARVLEIPTPTWQAYDEARFDMKMDVDGVPREHQERAYTSPIWYTPQN